MLCAWLTVQINAAHILGFVVVLWTKNIVISEGFVAKPLELLNVRSCTAKKKHTF